MRTVAENETERVAPVQSATTYRIHIPRGRALVCLPTDYETLEEAKLAFEIDSGEARWCFIGPYEPESDAPLYIVHGMVGEDAVLWKSVV